jgi:hypothetical protein
MNSRSYSKAFHIVQSMHYDILKLWQNCAFVGVTEVLIYSMAIEWLLSEPHAWTQHYLSYTHTHPHTHTTTNNINDQTHDYNSLLIIC